MVRVSWRDEDDGRHMKIDDGPEIIPGDGNLSYRERKTMPRRNNTGLNITVKIVAFFCLSLFTVLLAIKLLQYIFSGGL